MHLQQTDIFQRLLKGDAVPFNDWDYFRIIKDRVPKKSTAALKSSAYISGPTALRGSPSLSPQKDKSIANVINPRNSIMKNTGLKIAAVVMVLMFQSQ
jgi:hypothetical protein